MTLLTDQEKQQLFNMNIDSEYLSKKSNYDQKLRDAYKNFVNGLSITPNLEAACLVLTTEILRFTPFLEFMRSNFPHMPKQRYSIYAENLVKMVLENYFSDIT